MVPGHEDTGTAVCVGALTAETGDLAGLVNLVILEDSKFHLLLLVTNLLWSGVRLLLALFATTEQFGVEVEGRLGCHAVKGKGMVVLHGLATIRKALEGGRDLLTGLDGSLEVGDMGALLDIKGNGPTRKGLDKDLHGFLDNWIVFQAV